MKNFIATIFFCSTFAFSSITYGTQTPSLSRDLVDSDFQIELEGQINVLDKKELFKKSLNRVLDRLSGGLFDPASLRNIDVESYVQDFKMKGDNLIVIFDREKLSTLIAQNHIPLYLAPRPDIMVWVTTQEMDSNDFYIINETEDNSFSNSLLEKTKFYELGCFFPIMDADDAQMVSPENINNSQMDPIFSANNRYGIKYILTGSIREYDQSDYDFVWKLYDTQNLSMPVYQSISHGTTYDLGQIVAHEVVSYFAQKNSEFINVEDKISQKLNSESDQLNPNDVNNTTNNNKFVRMDIFGGLVSETEARVVVAGTQGYKQLMFVENSIKKIPDVKYSVMIQSQADQLVYSVQCKKTCKNLSKSIENIDGFLIPNSAQPLNFIYDSSRKNEQKNQSTEVTLENDNDTEQTMQTNINDSKNDNKNEPVSVVPNTEEKNTTDSKTQNSSDNSIEAIEAIPVTDDNIIDTSGRKL